MTDEGFGHDAMGSATIALFVFAELNGRITRFVNSHRLHFAGVFVSYLTIALVDGVRWKLCYRSDVIHYIPGTSI